ncbi:hypothetical protein KJ980_01695 [Patescibacteria group bacterium]|nr:hypothetical protein [Patescibacteria group bacterium]MBU4016890.1 hypothetical protein [Patescibacteria group bacterium]MBU4098341.1 hypothetical protein [Patescibacteria group bacterium]
MASLLVTRPLYEGTTHYLFFWNEAVINFAKSKSYKILDLKIKRANRKNLESYLRNKKPNLVLLNGHGSSDLITGQDDEVIIKVGENEELLKGTIVYALSCKTGQILGPKSIDKGTIAYIGYKENFNFWTNSSYVSRPNSDPRARLFFEPSNQIGLSLLKGRSVQEACHKAKNAFRENATKLIVTNSLDQFVIPDLLWNMVHLAHFGDNDAAI